MIDLSHTITTPLESTVSNVLLAHPTLKESQGLDCEYDTLVTLNGVRNTDFRE